MSRRAIETSAAPPALGPYSQAVVAGGLVFCSGTAGIDPATGVAPDGIEAQTEQALTNLAAVLEAAGSSMAHLVKTTIFYADVDDFARLNEVYARPTTGTLRAGERAATPWPAGLHRRHRGAARALSPAGRGRTTGPGAPASGMTGRWEPSASG